MTIPYDALGRITTVRSGGEIVESYVYTNRGRTVVSNTTTADGNPHKYTYQKDEYGVLSSEQNRLGDTKTYNYDNEGRNKQVTQFSNKEVFIDYDDTARTTTTRYEDGTLTVVAKDAAGRIISAKGPTGTISYRYDAGGKLIRQYDAKAGEETLYKYNMSGLRTKMDSGNREISYRYGKNGELLAVTDNKQRLFVTYTFDDMGREIARNYGNGVTQETRYDAIGRTVMIREIAASRELIRAEGYIYDAQGRRSYCVDEKGNVTAFEYDAQSRLANVLYPWTVEKAASDKLEAEQAGLFFTGDKGNPDRYMIPSEDITALRNVLNLMAFSRGSILGIAQSVWKESYTYDRSGNRKTKTTPWGTITYEYDADNRMLAMGSIQYAYDKDGNLISEKSLIKSAIYEYTDTNRMKTSVVSNTVKKTRTVSSYAYDAFGRRTLVQDAGGETMRTLYDGLRFDVIRENVTYGGI